MKPTLTPDLCVIGAGSGGLTVAAAAAAFGVPVVLVEKGRMGGDCLNYGCVPSKALIASARRVHMLRQAFQFGLGVPEPSVDFSKVLDHVAGVIAAIEPNDAQERFTGLGVTVLRETGRFLDKRTLIAGKQVIRARRFVVATGSTAAVPRIEGLEEVPYLTNETIFDLEELPGHLVILGGGPIGMELAQAFRRLGSTVTLVEAAEPLGREDPEIALPVLAAFEREGIALHARSRVVRAHVPHGGGVALTLNEEGGERIVAGSHLLVAVGRRPNVESLDLNAARIDFEPDGILVDKGLRTSNRRCYAIGDVVGNPRFTHLAGHHGGLVVRNALFRLPVDHRAAVVPRVTYTDPEIAHVGLSEEEARAAHKGVRILRWPYHENDRAQAERETTGHIKVTTDRRGRILGVSIVGARAGDLILMWTLAIQKGLSVRDIAGLIMPYPTFGEIGRRAAVSFYTPGLTNRWVRRIINILRRFG